MYGAITIINPGSKKGRYLIDLIDSIHLDQGIFNNAARISKFFYRLVKSAINDNKNSLFIPQPILDQQGVIDEGKLQKVDGKLIYLNSTTVFKFIKGKYPYGAHGCAA